MKATKAQYRSARQILRNNPSMRWDGEFGFYSNGQAVMTIHWDFDETKEKFNITLNPDGTKAIIKPNVIALLPVAD